MQKILDSFHNKVTSDMPTDDVIWATRHNGSTQGLERGAESEGKVNLLRNTL